VLEFDHSQGRSAFWRVLTLDRRRKLQFSRAKTSESDLVNKGKHSILGILVSAVDYQATVAAIADAALARRELAVSAMAVHGIMTGCLDPDHKHRLNNLDLIVPDGQPVKWALRWLHRIRLPDRVYGPQLMLDVCAAAERLKLPVFFYGSTEIVLATLAANLRKTFPALDIAGIESSRFRCLSSYERQEVISHIRESGARIVFVALGCPRQEVWAYEFRDALGLPIIAVGGAFAVHAKVVPQAPEWMQKRGLEWIFRLASEPSRLWRRYAILNPLFLVCLCLQTIGFPFATSGRKPSREILYG
jgi:N-acetylglucosaminyldiphosphoundecaprenol N-acetyl-beta-D-mannosaminyltransferase